MPKESVEKIGENYQYASLNRKIIALGIDIIIVTLVFSPISNFLSYFLFDINPTSFTGMESQMNQSNTINISEMTNSMVQAYSNKSFLFLQFIIFILVISYFILFWAKTSRSLGKMVMRCYILDADTYEKISMKQSIKRMLGHFLNFFTFGIGLFMADFTKRKQGLHDKIANTIVVTRKK
jgi:uncharacterized RDD family membrane protein YckC